MEHFREFSSLEYATVVRYASVFFIRKVAYTVAYGCQQCQEKSLHVADPIPDTSLGALSNLP